MLRKFIIFINLKTGRRFWYAVKLSYILNGNVISTWTKAIGLADARSILDYRECKKIFPPLHKIEFRNKLPLNNGQLNIEVVTFLGWFKKQLITIKKNNQ